MKSLRIALVLALVLIVASFAVASAQTGFSTQYTTSITYQNVGTGTALVTFQFYNEKTGTAVNVQRQLNANAGSSLFVGGLTGSEALPSNFLGSAVLSANQPIVATLVQVPQNSPVKNRPLSNGFSSGSSQVLLATVLKNTFSNSSVFSIQNADTGPVDITLKFYRVGETTAIATLTETNIPVGAAKYYNAGNISQLGASFNGSVTVTAVKTGTSTPANIVGSVLELGTSNLAAKAFEGVGAGNPTVNVATALCNAFGGFTTAYAVQNTDTTNKATVTVEYKNLSGGSVGSETKEISAGGKQSFIACDKAPSNFSGSAKVSSTGGAIVVIAKVFLSSDPSYGTAFLGEAAGSSKLALPYVRYTSDANYNAGTRQRTFIAIQNIGVDKVDNVTVKYLDKNGTVLGTHTIATIAGGAKQNSNPTAATGDAAKLMEFGNPEANPGGGFGGAAIVEGPAGSQLIAVARVQSIASGKVVAEDYNGIGIATP